MGLLNFRQKTNPVDDSDMNSDIEEFNQLFDNITFGDLDHDDGENISEESINFTKKTMKRSGLILNNSAEHFSVKNSDGKMYEELNEEAAVGKELCLIENKDLNFALVWNNKGVALSKLGRYPEALEAYDRALELAPDYLSAWNNKGVALSKLSRYVEAINAFDQILCSDPNYSTLPDTDLMSESEA
jgi:tetratricopeptide (TPR) repeat protein